MSSHKQDLLSSIRGKTMRILMIAHIGETLGHLVRGLAIADALTALGAQVEFAASKRSEELLCNREPHYILHKLRWRFSHNSCNPDNPPTSFLRHIIESNVQVLELLTTLPRHSRPDLII